MTETKEDRRARLKRSRRRNRARQRKSARRGSTLTRASDIEAKPPPRCTRCGIAMHYEDGTQEREDESAGRPAPGWRCPRDLGRASAHGD